MPEQSGIELRFSPAQKAQCLPRRPYSGQMRRGAEYRRTRRLFRRSAFVLREQVWQIKALAEKKHLRDIPLGRSHNLRNFGFFARARNRHARRKGVGGVYAKRAFDKFVKQCITRTQSGIQAPDIYVRIHQAAPNARKLRLRFSNIAMPVKSLPVKVRGAYGIAVNHENFADSRPGKQRQNGRTHTANTYREPPTGMKYNSQRFIACDYGTTNPCVFLDIYDDGERIRVDREYRWDSRKERRQKTDQEYADDFMVFMGDDWCTVLVDPSAASFITALRQRGIYVREADNTVLDGIRRTGALFAQRVLLVNETNCMGLIGELGSYMWDDKAAQRGEEKAVKQQDHGPDALRYFVNDLPDWRFEGVPTE